MARETPNELTMQAIATRAEIGPATAYRYYSTIEDVLAAYSLGVVGELIEYSEECALKGRLLFEAVLGKWLELLEEHGAALTQLRSRRGYLERLHAGADTIVATERAWRRPVSSLLDELGLPTDQLEYALFLSNIIFDPREIGDLRKEAKLSQSEIAARLTASYIGALRGWFQG
ncbi:TetR family transcriptional regulator [Prauserella sp. PE36]|uniref:TetR family transcriptional regulator n=1 Tax=Prauserella sp. PE36 TaxID=1504709 RepID=UPI001F2E0CCC|nr:TetR family transcriptional regulator [Prauserella sp. PE36]